MSTQIRFRLSGEEEQAFLTAARLAGLSPDAYARVRALTPVDLPAAIEQRLADIETKLGESRTEVHTMGPAALVKGLNADDLMIELRREVRAGVSAFLVLLDGEPLSDRAT